MKLIYLVYSFPIMLAAGLACYFPTSRKWFAGVFTARILAILGFALLMAGFVLSLTLAPISTLTDGTTADYAQKIFYYHVPVAISSFLGFFLAAIYGGLFLSKQERRYDFLSLASVEIGFLFGFLVELTGVIWTRAAWGVWWQWEPRLTTYLILMLMYAGYFALRSAMNDDAAKAKFGAVYSIIAVVSVPLTALSIRLVPSIHPVVFTAGGAQMPLTMSAPFLIATVGMALFSLAMIRTKYTVYLFTEEIEYLAEGLEG